MCLLRTVQSRLQIGPTKVYTVHERPGTWVSGRHVSHFPVLHSRDEGAAEKTALPILLPLTGNTAQDLGELIRPVLCLIGNGEIKRLPNFRNQGSVLCAASLLQFSSFFCNQEQDDALLSHMHTNAHPSTCLLGGSIY